MTLKFIPSGNGLSKVFNAYQEKAIKYMWDGGNKGAKSLNVWANVNQNLNERTISRASIINFLNSLVDEGVLDFHMESGKGGYHRVYKPKLDEYEFKKYLAETMISSLMKDFPNETKEVLRTFEY